MRYEVTLVLDAGADVVESLCRRWGSMGGSVVITAEEGGWRCHVHTDRIGDVIEAAVAAGRPRQIAVTDLREGSCSSVVSATGLPDFEVMPEALVAPVGVVAVASGPGIIDVFRKLGVQALVVGDRSMRPNPDDLLAAVEAAPAPRVVVLPNDKSTVALAEQLDALTTKEVVVVPTRSIPQGIAALMGYSLQEDDPAAVAETMSAAASSVIDAEVSRAPRDAVVPFGLISRGDWMGIADGTVVVADSDLETTLRQLVAGIWLEGSEVITIYTGDGALPTATKTLEAWIGDVYTGTEVVVVDGGQPRAPYLISIE